MGLSWTTRLFAAVLLAAGAAAAVETDFYAGLDAFRREDFETARKVWTPLAEAGEAESQYRLARLYAEGLGIAQDDAAAVVWYGRAAAQGHARAQSSLGYMLHAGRGAERDVLAAIEWYRKAADQGRATAQRNLGQIYLEGDGVEPDLAEAVRLLKSAADQGNTSAQTTLGTLYGEGRGVESDPEQAFKLYKKAAKERFPEAEYHVGRAYFDGIGTKQDLKKALRYYSRAADQGNAAAQAALDEIDAGAFAEVETAPEPAKQPGVARQPEAAKRPKVVEQPQVAKQPETEKPAEPTVPPAIKPVKPTATESLNTDQAYERGRALMLGHGVPRDLDRAATYLRQAAEAGHAQAAYRLALLLFRGDTGDKSRRFVEAWIWFDAAAKAGVGDATEWREKVDEKLTDRERAEVEAQR